jgi:hypothetical protein
MLLLALLTLPVWYVVYAASKHIQARQTGLKRRLARVLFSIAWLIIWLFLLGVIGMSTHDRLFLRGSLAYLHLDVLALGFFAIFRFTKGLSSHAGDGVASVTEQWKCSGCGAWNLLYASSCSLCGRSRQLEDKSPSASDASSNLAREAERYLEARRQEREAKEKERPESMM